MDYVEYIQIFISLVLGLAFTRIITSYAIIIKYSNRTKFYWPYFPISIGLLIFIINDFWTGFERSKALSNGSGFDQKIAFVLALVTPLSYTLVAELLHPKVSEDKFYYMKDIVTARKTAYILGALNVTFTFIRALLSSLVSTTITAQLIRLTILAIFTIGIFSKNELVQKCIAVLFFLMSVIWFLFENTG